MSKQMLSDVQDRANDIERLEKNIRELHQMFLDMAELVSEQGQTIDNIEFNVNQTRDYVAETRKELPKAVDFKRAARRVNFFLAPNR
jgi:t-SNARE complex subunit (syntaxin)